MNADKLLAHYERIAEAPDAIAQLRQFVLELAIRGKLVAQDPADNTVVQCLKTVSSVPLPKGAFEIPANWEWVSVGSVAESRLGKMLDKTKNRGMPKPYLRNVNVRWFGFDLSDLFVMPFEDRELTEFALHSGDVLICEGGEPGRAAVWRGSSEEIYFQKALHRVRFNEFVLSDFFVFAIRASADDGRLADSFTGTGIKHFTGRSLDAYAFPLPPLAEQHRIVDKIDELMALCDRLEESRKEREAARDRLTAASLARLNAPNPDQATFSTHARFALDNLTKLSSHHRQVAQWKATIIELAARGRLSLENSRDTPPAKALEAIDEARDALVKAKVLRREKPLAAIRSEELPFLAPASWAWARLGDIALFTQYGTSLKAEQTSVGVPVLTMGNIQSGTVVSAKEKRIPSQSPELPELYLKKFDLLYNRTNSPELVGKTGIYLGRDYCVTFASYLIRLRFVVDHTDPHFINLAMNAPGFRSSQIAPYIKQQTGQANVNGTAMKNMLIALPPIEEQRRIVAKVDELMALCGRLQTCLASGDDTRRRLLESILHEALEPTEERELEPA